MSNNNQQLQSQQHQHQQHQLIRPTEAQLRWAQFHHRRRAVQCREYVERIWQLPPDVKDVPDALSEDGNTTEESFELPRPRPKISRGRRALLRVSKRSLELRRENIMKHGFRSSALLQDDSSRYSDDSDSEGDEEEDALAAIFAEEAYLRKRRRRHHRMRRRLHGGGGAGRSTDERERVRRFEAAFHSMMMRMAASVQSEVSPEISTPSKIWTRPSSMGPEQIMDYSDLKWGMPSQKKSKPAGNMSNATIDFAPLDRGASWLVHLPATSPRNTKQPMPHPQLHQGLQQEQPFDEDFEDSYSDFPLKEGTDMPIPWTLMPGPAAAARTASHTGTSLMRRTFSNIVESLQQQLNNRQKGEEEAVEEGREDSSLNNPEMMHLSKYFQPAQLDQQQEIREEKKDDTGSEYDNYTSSDKDAETASRKVDGSRTPRLLRAFLLGDDDDEDNDELYRDQQQNNNASQEFDAAHSSHREISTPASSTPRRRGQGTLLSHDNSGRQGQSQELEAALAFESPHPVLHERLSSLRKLGRRSSIFVNSVLEQWKEEDERDNSPGGYNRSLLRDLEPANPGLSKKLFTLYLEENCCDLRDQQEARQRLIEAARQELNRYAQRYMWEQKHGISDPATMITKQQMSYNSNSNNNRRFVGRLVAQLEEAVAKGEEEALVSADGKLHRATFARMVRRYLVEARQDKASFKSRSEATKEEMGSPGNRGRISDQYLSGVREGHSVEVVEDYGDDEFEPTSRTAVAAIVDSFLSKLEQAPEEELSGVLNADGNLNGSVFEQVVARYLAEATGNSQEDVLTATDLEGLKKSNPNSIPTEPPTAALDEPPKVNPIFVKNFVAQIQRAAEVEELFTPEGKLVKPAFEKLLLRYVQQDAPKTNRAFTMDVRSPLMLARARQSARKPSRFGQDSLDNAGPPMLDSPAVVRRFLSCMEKESEEVVRSIRKPNGKLDAAVFESLVDRCLSEAMSSKDKEKHQQLPEKKILGGDNELRKSKLFVHDESMDDFVHTFVDHCVNVARESLFVNQSKVVDKVELRGAVVSCLQRQQQNLRPNDDPNLESFVDCFVGLVEEECMLGSFRGAVMGEDHILLEDLSRHWTEEAAHEYNLHQGDFQKFTDSLVSSSLPTAHTYLGSNSSYSPDAPDRKPNASLSEASDHASKKSLDTNEEEGRAVTRYDGGVAGVLANKLAGSVSGKIGGFMKMLHNVSQHSEDEELEAVAAFRRTQGERPPDDTSSFSSVLPDGIKKVVQNFQRGQLRRNNEETEGNITDISSVPEGSSVVDSLDNGLSSFSLSHSTNHQPEFSPERLKAFHHNVMEKSVLTGGDQNRSIIDTDGSEASHQGMDPGALSNLLLSPTILTKRHQQAIRAVEMRNWDQVEYLMSANPWLAEMTDLKTNQYLVHKVALYGTGEREQKPAPDHINTDLIRINPSSIHKFDSDGNLPLHMAAISGNNKMITLLGDRFSSGASVRNEDGMLPLHLVILAVASPQTCEKIIELGVTPISLVKKVLDYFPGAVAVGENLGNLPIHTAVTAARGDHCVDIVNLLLDEAERQVKDSTVQFRNKLKLDQEGSEVSVGTESLDYLGNNNDDVLHCNLVQNENGDTPLWTAIQSKAGRKVVEALVTGPGGHMAALLQDSQQNNALHRLVSSKDSASVLCILKAAPEAASARNEDNMLPIEIACRNSLPREVILALVLVDLPFDLDDTNCEGRRDGYGASWFFLACECDDYYADVVEEVVSFCSYSQARELCFFDNGSGETLLARATPRCRGILQQTLRFLGRFEFQTLLKVDDPDSYRVFSAIDFGSRDEPFPKGRPVVLKCYISEELYEEETVHFRELEFDFSLLEEVDIFGVGEDGMPTSTGAKQYCVSIEQPDLTLGGVVEGMRKNKNCQTDPTVRKRYAEKVFAVLRVVAKSLRYLHGIGIVHGDICTSSCGKYGNKWKISNLLGIRRVGDGFAENRLSMSAPPEAIDADGGSIREGFQAQPSIDAWAFGKLSFEVLIGEPLFPSLNTEDLDQRNDTLTLVSLWNEHDLEAVRRRLKEAYVSDAGISLILECLLPQPERRPSMAELLTRPFWNEIRRPERSKKEES